MEPLRLCELPGNQTTQALTSKNIEQVLKESPNRRDVLVTVHKFILGKSEVELRQAAQNV